MILHLSVNILKAIELYINCVNCTVCEHLKKAVKKKNVQLKILSLTCFPHSPNVPQPADLDVSQAEGPPAITLPWGSLVPTWLRPSLPLPSPLLTLSSTTLGLEPTNAPHANPSQLHYHSRAPGSPTVPSLELSQSELLTCQHSHFSGPGENQISPLTVISGQ